VLSNALIQVIGSNPLLQELSTTNGIYKTGQQEEGYYKVRVSKSGFQDYETYIHFQRGEVIELNVPLFPNGMFNVSGTVIRHSNGQPVENATVWLYGAQNFGPVTTDVAGAFNFNNIPPGIYDIAASAPGLGLGMLSGQTIVGNTNVTIELFSTHRRGSVKEREEGILENKFLNSTKNPFETETVLNYQIPEGGASITLLNSLGQTVQTLELSDSVGQLTFGAGLPAGVYFAVLKQLGKVLEVKRLVKDGRQ